MAKKEETKKKTGVFSKVKGCAGKLLSVGKTVCMVTGFVTIYNGLRNASADQKKPEVIHNAETTVPNNVSNREIFDVETPDTSMADLEYQG